MPQGSGSVTASREARVGVRFSDGAEIECLIDTSSDGALMLPRLFVERLQLPVVGRLVFQVAGGTRINADIALAEVEWLAEERIFEVVVSESEDSLIGTEMRDGTELIINYTVLTVTITNLN